MVLRIPEFAHYLAPNARIVKDQNFENAVGKLQNNNLELTAAESVAVAHFLKPTTSSSITTTQFEHTDDIVARGQLLKRSKAEKSPYRSVNHVSPTSNVVERLFSVAKRIMTQDRKKMSAEHFSSVLFLKCNIHRWNAKTIQKVIESKYKFDDPAEIIFNIPTSASIPLTQEEIDDDRDTSLTINPYEEEDEYLYEEENEDLEGEASNVSVEEEMNANEEFKSAV